MCSVIACWKPHRHTKNVECSGHLRSTVMSVYFCIWYKVIVTQTIRSIFYLRSLSWNTDFLHMGKKGQINVLISSFYQRRMVRDRIQESSLFETLLSIYCSCSPISRPGSNDGFLIWTADFVSLKIVCLWYNLFYCEGECITCIHICKPWTKWLIMCWSSCFSSLILISI